tara:strand:- start:216 stop:431 length:216 start_codon:yes stop_codon:yes gene_type:complete
MTDDLVKRLRNWQQYGPYRPSRYKEAADRIEWMQDVIARIQYTNLRRDMNAKNRTITIDKLCKGRHHEADL